MYQTHKGRKQRLLVMGALIFILGTVSIVVFLYFNNQTKCLKAEYEQIMNTAQLEKQNQQRMVYVANRDIKAGERVTSLDVTYDNVYSSMDDSLFAVIGDSYKVARIDIPQGVQIMGAMVSEEEIENHVREEEFGMIYLSDNLVQNDRVDVRIFFPNGENYIVLSKKCLKDIRLDTATCYLWLDEQETLLISSAIIDAYTIEGAYLYTTRYVENSMQEPSVVTYTPSQDVIELLEDSPNILEEAKLSLSRKVRQSLKERIDLYRRNEEEKTNQELPDFVYHGVNQINMETQDEVLEKDEESEDEIIYVD